MKSVDGLKAVETVERLGGHSTVWGLPLQVADSDSDKPRQPGSSVHFYERKEGSAHAEIVDEP